MLITAWIIGLVVIGALTALLAIYHKQIVDWLTPFSNKLRKYAQLRILLTTGGGTQVQLFVRSLTAGWVIPIAILFIISFPPVCIIPSYLVRRALLTRGNQLFGHEIIAVLCGVVWGLWVGFGIVAAGTFLGEVGNFYAFRSICSARGRKLEKENLSYASLAYIVREGGFWVCSFLLMLECKI